MARWTDPYFRRAPWHPADPDRRAGNRPGQKPIDFRTITRAEAQDRAHRIIEAARAIDDFNKTVGCECARVLKSQPGLFACRDRPSIDDRDIALRRQRDRRSWALTA
jgi:hypothetical protein